MSKRTATWIVWSMWTLSLALTALSLLLLYFNRSYPDVPVYTYWVVDTLLAIGLSTVGAAIVPRCPPKPNRVAILCNRPAIRGGTFLYRVWYLFAASNICTASSR